MCNQVQSGPVFCFLFFSLSIFHRFAFLPISRLIYSIVLLLILFFTDMSSELLQEVPKSIEHVKHIILILSGKGGVGKSSVTTQVALTLVNKGFNVGVLDIDLTGPSLPRMFEWKTNKYINQHKDGYLFLCIITIIIKEQILSVGIFH